MKKIILAVFMLLGILTCNEDEKFEHQLKPDSETITKLITGFDDTLKIVLSSSENNSDKQIDDIYLHEITQLGIKLKKHSTQPFENSDKNAGYSSEFINFISQIEMGLQFESKNAYKTHLAYLNSAVLNSNISISKKQVLINRIAFMNAFVDWMGTLKNSSAPLFDTNSYSINEEDSWWSSWGGCVAGILGGAGLGALEGTGVGAVTIPIIGSVPGAAIGAIAGGLAGASAACN